MANFYERMQSTATRLLTKFQQGTILLRRSTVSSGSSPWNPSISSFTDYTLRCVVEPVYTKYIDNTTVLSTDRMVLFDILEVEPVLTDRIVIDGKTFEIKRLLRYPNAGIPIYYTAIINA